MTENQRLKILQKLLGFKTQVLFADALNLKPGTLSDILREKEGVGVSAATKRILEKSYNVNIDWLETGIGEKLAPKGENNTHKDYSLSIETDNQFNNKIDNKYNPINDIVTPNGIITNHRVNRRKSNALIPFYNADFMAGAAEMFYEDATIYPEYYMDVPEFYGCTAFRAYSDSMESKIRSGNILFGIKVDDWRSHLEYGQIYGITCTDGRRYLKYIRKCQDEKHFLLKSENDSYDDFTIPKSKVKNIWLIEGWLDKRT